MKQCLTRAAFPERYRPWDPKPRRRVRRALVRALRRVLARARLDLVRPARFDAAKRAAGLDHPAEAETMIGLRRLDNLQHCITSVLRDRVPGDFIETGVWRGGGSIFMRACLQAYGDTERRVWVADSFQGLPEPDARFPADRGDLHFTKDHLAITLDTVRANFARYGLLDDRVRFLEGWFADTLPHAPIEQLAILRLDGDMYGSTMDALQPLYPKLQKGGYVIIDDYVLPGCRKAIEDYRAEFGITETIIDIDGSGAFWRKQG
jgi:O-methyltransferase